MTWKEVENLMIEISLEPDIRSLILQARNKMTNLNLGSQEVLAEKLESNTRKISNADLEIFLNEKNQSLQKNS